jgi:dCTP deaminase
MQPIKAPESRAGIKSDLWIQRQCMPPTFVVTEQVQIGTQMRKNTFFTHADEESVKAAVAASGPMPGSIFDRCGYVSYRPLNDEEKAAFKPMIEPYEPRQVRTREVKEYGVVKGEYTREIEKIVSYGTSSYGYDVSCSDEFKIFTNVNSAIVDPKNFDDNSFVAVKATKEKPYIIIPPNSFALAVTREYLRIPRNVLTVCLGKSTYARCGIIVNVTPFEPEWEGYVTLEFSNTTPLPAKIYANEGCAQVLFFQSDEDCETSYKDRGGKYMHQLSSPIPPKV